MGGISAPPIAPSAVCSALIGMAGGFVRGADERGGATPSSSGATSRWRAGGRVAPLALRLYLADSY